MSIVKRRKYLSALFVIINQRDLHINNINTLRPFTVLEIFLVEIRILFIYVTSFHRLHQIVGKKRITIMLISQMYLYCLLLSLWRISSLLESSPFQVFLEVLRGCLNRAPDKSVFSETAAAPPDISVSCQMVLSAGRFLQCACCS